MKSSNPYQFNLFDQPPVKSPAVVLDIRKAMHGKNEGIERAADHADDIDPEWNDKAFNLLKKFLNNHNGTFMTEEVRVYAELMELKPPPDKRAWGAVMMRAARKGLIESCGYDKTKNVKAHRTPAAIWKPIKL